MLFRSLMKADELGGAFSVVGQLTTIMTRRNTDQQLDLLADGDVLIRPDLEGYTSADFYDAPVLFELGASAAREHGVELRPLSVTREAWAAWRDNVAAQDDGANIVSRIEIEDSRRLASDFLRERIRQRIGEPLDTEQL